MKIEQREKKREMKGETKIFQKISYYINDFEPIVILIKIKISYLLFGSNLQSLKIIFSVKL